MKKVSRMILLFSAISLLSSSDVKGDIDNKQYAKPETVLAGIDIGDMQYIERVTDQTPAEQTQPEVKEKEYISGWVTESVNIRKSPSTDSEILDVYRFNYKVYYTDYNKKWVKIKYKKKEAYVCKDYISNDRPKYKTFEVPENSGFKSFMSYKCITSKSSDQYKLQYNKAYTGTYGIRQVNGRYCVAIGSYFTSEIGTKFDLVLKNGTIIPCVLADQKANTDTDSMNVVTRHNGCVSEFVVDDNVLHNKARQMGDISYCNKNWKSPVTTIRIY